MKNICEYEGGSSLEFEQAIFDAAKSIDVPYFCMKPLLPYLGDDMRISNFPEEVFIRYSRDNVFWFDFASLNAQVERGPFFLSEVMKKVDSWRTDYFYHKAFLESAAALQSQVVRELLFVPLNIMERVRIIAILGADGFSSRQVNECVLLANSAYHVMREQFEDQYDIKGHTAKLEILRRFGAGEAKNSLSKKPGWSEAKVDDAIASCMKAANVKTEKEVRKLLAEHARMLREFITVKTSG